MSSFKPHQQAPGPLKSRNVTAVLGPTNTGKTHLAIERMLSHQSGMIGLPLRLLAREVYDKIVKRIGPSEVALITGEEKIKPENPRFYVSTVEAMPRDISVDFLAVDEIQLAADPERGHVFTERLFNARGVSETLLLGAGTMRETIKELLPGANFVSRPRLSKLTFAGQKKMSRLPRRSAIVAFSAAEVYEIAELIRRQRGGAAVVLGALSPRTRNAQVALYQSGDVDLLVATDAIGMGLNLDLDHVAFSSVRKFDGRAHRNLTNAEIGQIAGRAGRHMNDGTFGVTGDAEPFSAEVIEQLEKHEFEPVKVLQWRNSELDFRTLEALKESLRELPNHPRLTRARTADDVIALENLSLDTQITELATSPDAVAKLWEVAQVPDYRKMSVASHAEMIGTLYTFLMRGRQRIPEDWFAGQVEMANRTDGDIDTLANRLAHIRTWTFVANRAAWLERTEYWQGRTREIEDQLSDALHEQLTQRFVDKRTSVLMRRLRDDDELAAEIRDDGQIFVEQHYVGRLKGFLFSPDSTDEGVHGKAARNAAAQVLTKELEMRVRRVASARNDAFKLDNRGRILWRGDEIARLERGSEPLKPQVVLTADEHLQVADRERLQTRLGEWFGWLVAERLRPLIELQKAEDVAGLARGMSFRLGESFGILKRETVAEEMRSLDQASRGQLRKYGVRFGAFNIFFPALLKPAPSELLLTLWMLQNIDRVDGKEPPTPPRAGLTSVATDPAVPEAFYRAAGYHVCGPRAVRVDMLERLADMIRPLISWRPAGEATTAPPAGATGDGGFTVVPEMMSILGCSSMELGEVLKTLGFRVERKPAPPKVAAPPTPEAIPAAPEATPPTPGTTMSEPEVATTGETIVAEAGAPDLAASETPAVSDAPVMATPPEPAAVETASAIDTPAGTDAPAADAIGALSVPAGDAASEATATAEEPAFIEIWRPRRRRSEDLGHRREARGGRGRRPDRRHDAAAATPVEGTAPAAPAAAEGAPAVSSEPARHEHRRDRRPERKPGDRREGGHREGGHHGKRRDERGRRDERRSDQPMRAGREEKRDTYDPNSPFAALGKLKQQLEEQKRNNS